MRPSVPFLTALLACTLLAGCMQARLEASARLLARHTVRIEPTERLPEVRVHRVRHPETGVVVRRWSALVQPDGSEERHGLDERWWPDGRPRSRREFRHGRETGSWTTWYADGTVRSEYRFAGPDEPSPMEFFHANGGLSARGMARDGVREGQWVFHRADGTKAKEGAYEGGLKSGEWTFYHPGGGLASRGRYVADERVGDWTHWPAQPPTFEARGVQ